MMENGKLDLFEEMAFVIRQISAAASDNNVNKIRYPGLLCTDVHFNYVNLEIYLLFQHGIFKKSSSCPISSRGVTPYMFFRAENPPGVYILYM
jgi:hypothetical protein